MRRRADLDKQPVSQQSRLLRVGALVAVVTLAVSVSAGTLWAAGSGGPSSLSRPYGFEAAKAATVRAFQGTNTNVDPTRRHAVKGKHVFVISQGQENLSAAIPSNGAMAAAQAMGWQATLLDGKLNPANYGPLVQQAIAQGADGIVVVAIDCNQMEAPLQQAKARHIVTIPIYGYDCNDPLEKAGPSLFTTVENFNNLSAGTLGLFAESYGRDQANYIISTSNNQAKILLVNDPEFTVLKHTAAGFADQIAHSGGSKIVDRLNFVSADLNTPKVVQEIQAELLKHPEINWIKSPYTFASLLGVEPAIANQPGKYKVMGGEGFQPELNLIRNGSFTAANVIDSEWSGWAGIDAMNSVFRHEKTRPSGIGWTITDATHNLPPPSALVPPPAIDFKTEFKQVWGVR
jgi:ribose transport system substrate-binding protein